MLRFLFRMFFRVFVLLALLGAGAYYWAYGWGDHRDVVRSTADRVDDFIDRDSVRRVSHEVRQAGREVAHAVAGRADHAKVLLDEARITAKIKSKMALDDTIAAGRLDVETTGTTVTVRGTVDTDAQRQRALQLARETVGVQSVIDRIDVVRANPGTRD